MSYRRLHELTVIAIDTMRGWVKRAQVDGGKGPGLTSAEREEIVRGHRSLALSGHLTTPAFPESPLIERRMGSMGRQGRYSPEVRERAVRLVLEQKDDHESQ